MSVAALERLVHTYYGYVVDLEGSGVAVLDLLFVRDKMHAILHRLTPDAALPTSLYERIDDLDALLREERSTFLMAVGQEELRTPGVVRGVPVPIGGGIWTSCRLHRRQCRSTVSVWRRPFGTMRLRALFPSLAPGVR